MTNESSSKAAILRRIRSANGAPSTEAAARNAWNGISRCYRRSGLRGKQQLLQLFEDRLRDYDATVTHTDAEHLALSVSKILKLREMFRMVLPPGLPSAWLPEGFEFEVDDQLLSRELDLFDGVLTGSTLAIAETGTVVLQSVPGQGRRAVSLVPDYHLCVVDADRIVETVPEAMIQLQQTACLATTFISGPSATSDIEMTRIKGVHGPRILDVLLIV